jgi:hypothetical protein
MPIAFEVRTLKALPQFRFDARIECSRRCGEKLSVDTEQDKGRLLRRNTPSRRLNVTQSYRADLAVIFRDSLDCEPVPFCGWNLESKQTRKNMPFRGMRAWNYEARARIN